MTVALRSTPCTLMMKNKTRQETSLMGVLPAFFVME